MEQVEAVISGIGGRFPRSKNIQEFSQHLLSGQSLLRPAERWTPGYLGTPALVGQIDDADRFDYSFSSMHFKLTQQADPMCRLAVETAFEALIDAGVCPQSVKGTHAQVFAGTMHSECDFYGNSETSEITAYTIMGKNRAMIANRISYALNLSGNSSTFESSGGWLGAGLRLARDAIRTGACDMVFVNACALSLVPETSLQKYHLGLLSPDGSCRPFDVDANGVAKGDASVTFVVQPAHKAKRIYGTIMAASSETQGILPNWFLSINEDRLRQFIGELYRNNNLDPQDIKILEADGLALKSMVEPELNVLDAILNSKRSASDPLRVGSVKTVLGDTDAAAGSVALTKLILAMETGVISPTLDCGKLNPNIPGLATGRYKVVTQPTRWEVTPKTCVAVSSLSTSGMVSHVVLRANGKTKSPESRKKGVLPHLVVVSGRSEEGVLRSLKKVASSPFDAEYLRLTQEVFSQSIDNFVWRGFGIHGETEAHDFVVQRETKRPVWFVYSGMGSQWARMGKELFHFPVINETFQRLHKILEPKGVDLINILTTFDVSIFDNIMHAFVGIAAIQIALTNLLWQLGIQPDGILGHSVGELGCSYGDGCLTEEQTIMVAYERGMVSITSELIHGLMAAVGLGYAECRGLLPPDVYVACRNARDNCTLSGPTESVKKVIQSFEEQGIFVRGVNVANIAYHSPYIRPAAPAFYEAIKKIIPDPKRRSPRWICTSQPRDKWRREEVRYCSAEYHTNNLLNPVLFEEGSKYIPFDAVVIEIAPHGLLQAILKRSLGGLVAHVPLTRRAAQSPAKFLLKAVGKLFLEGLSPKIWHMYPDVEMPVSRNTPSLAPLMEWVHEEKFPLKFNEPGRWVKVVNRTVDYSSPSMEIAGSKYLLPAYSLVTVLEVFAEMTGKLFENLKARLEDIVFSDLVKLDSKDAVRLTVNILPETGKFVVLKDDSIVVKGKIATHEIENLVPKTIPAVGKDVELCLESSDIYSEFGKRCMSVQERAKNITNLQILSRDWLAGVRFDGDWIRLLNSLITLAQLQSNDEEQKPTYVSYIQDLVVDTSKTKTIETNARLYLPTLSLFYQGISLNGLKFTAMEDLQKYTQPSTLTFIPFGQTCLEDEKQFLSHVVQLSLEKRLYRPFLYKIHKLTYDYSALNQQIEDVLKSHIGLEYERSDEPKTANMLLCAPKYLRSMVATLKRSNAVLLTRCEKDNRREFNETLKEIGLCILAENGAGSLVAVSSKLPTLRPEDCQVIKMKPHQEIPVGFEDPGHSLVIFVWEDGADYPSEKMLQHLRNTECPEKIRLVVLKTPNAPPFSMNLPMYADQLSLNMPLNIYMGGKWGSYQLMQTKLMSSGQKRELTLRTDSLPDRIMNQIKIDASAVEIHRVSNKKMTSQVSNEAIGYSIRNNKTGRIMGVGSYDGRSEFFEPVPNLLWEVPQEWDLANISNVPLSYAMAYYCLLEVARVKSSDSIFITCPLKPVGQAAVRISESLGCQTIALVSSNQEKKQLETIFPKLKRTIVCASDTFSFELRKVLLDGVDVVISDLTGSRLKAVSTCLNQSPTCKRSKLVQVNQDGMHKREIMGMYMYCFNASTYGVSEQALLSAPVEVKGRVEKWVREGLDSGIVRPLALAKNKLNEYSRTNGNGYTNGYNHTNGNYTNGYNHTNGNYTNDYKHSNGNHTIHGDVTKSKKQPTCSVIVDTTNGQWTGLAHSLASRGSKRIALVQKNTSPNTVGRHTKILKRAFGTELKDLKGTTSAIDIAELGGVDTVYIFQQSNLAEEVFQELTSRGMEDTWVVLFEKTPSRFSWMSERRAKDGHKVRSVLGVDALPTVTATPLLDWILSPGAPAVIVLDTAVYSSDKTETLVLNQTRLLPTSVAELERLGSALRGKTCPSFREVATRGLKIHRKGEVEPLFFIKGIHGTALSEVKNLAADLLSPLVEVTLHTGKSFEETALAVVEGIRKIQTKGPYNVAGDPIHAHLALEVARILENRGFASVVFMIDEGIDSIREGLIVLQKKNALGESLIQCALSANVDHRDFKKINWSNLTWEQQVEKAISLVERGHRENIAAALHHLHSCVQHFMLKQEKDLPTYGLVHTLRKGKEYRFYDRGQRSYEHIIPSSTLKRKGIAEIIASNLATPVLQLNLHRGVIIEPPVTTDD